MKLLSLVVPGLPGWPGLRQADVATLGLDALDHALSRADMHSVPAQGLEATLYHLYGMPRDPAHDLPVAAITRLCDMGLQSDDAPGAWWLRADPVHLHISRERLTLFDSRVLSITAHEAEALAWEFNTLFAMDGWHLQTPCPERWYLRLPSDPKLHTHPLNDVIGRSIDGRLPSGEAAPHWNAALTEVQMLFHVSTVNQDREAQGLSTINGIWPWGGGVTPESVPKPWTQVWSDEPFTVGLTRLAGGLPSPPPASATAWLERAGEGEHLVVLDELLTPALYGDRGEWGVLLEQFHQQWFEPLMEALHRRDLALVRLYSGDGRRFEIKRSTLRRWWRRRKGWEAYFG